MAFSAERLLEHAFPVRKHRYLRRDAILYALGVGLGADPLDPTDLAFLNEKDLSILPTFAVTLASPGLWVQAPELEIDWRRLVHSAQAATFHAPLPPETEVIGHARIASVTDFGAGRGAEVVVERLIEDADAGQRYCTLRQTLLLRGNGGFAVEPAPKTQRIMPPARAADETISFAVSPRAALIYRLSGDWNPLHIDPAAAAKAGFPRPILHGLCSYAIAGWVASKSAGRQDGAALTSLAMRFASPVFPGDRLDFALWRTGSRIDFSAAVDGRTVLDQGVAEFST